MSKSASTLLLFLCAGVVTSQTGCKKKQQPPPPPTQAAAPGAPATPLPDIKCPAPETFAPLGTEQGSPSRAFRTDCVVFAPGRYWLASALSYEDKTGKAPRLHLMSGGTGDRIIVFDVEPLPSAEIEALVKQSKEVGVKIRKTHDDRALVRLGVTGRSGTSERPELREVGMLLQLAAHQPPRVLWVGPGDQVSTGADGCINEQVVDFELLFRTRLERFTVVRARPAPGAKAANCPTGPSMQDSVSYQPVPLKKGRPLVAEAAPPKR
jgi:hypothetical protein